MVFNSAFKGLKKSGLSVTFMPVMYRNVVWKNVQMQSKFTARNVIASVKDVCEMSYTSMSGNTGLFLRSLMYILLFHPVRGF